MADVSATGLTVTVFATKTFPAGVTLSQFADDADPLDIPEIEIVADGMNVNGELVTWNTPKPIYVALNVIADTEDSENLDIIFDGNRAAYKKTAIRDKITLCVNYPDGKRKTLTGGRPKAYVPSTGVASSGRKKSKLYRFVFENKLN